MKILILIASLYFLIGCQTSPFSGQAEYEETIASQSAGDKQFAGLYHNFEFRATLMSTGIINTLNNRMTRMYDWDPIEKQKDLQKRQDNAAKVTRFFMSFYTSDWSDDNLTSVKSIWKVYLHSGSQRYEGRVLKSNKNLSEAKALYPYHNRWATAYYLEFPVATQSVENETLRLVITGPLGRREVSLSASSIKL